MSFAYEGAQSEYDFVEMDDGVRLRTWTSGSASQNSPPLVTVHGGPGVPDYLRPVHETVTDLCRAHRYDQRGVGGSSWAGEHTIARHVRDLELLLDAWAYDRAVLLGHSFGTDLVSFFLLAHPDRVAGVIYLSGPFLGPWRERTRAVERSRRSQQQQDRLDELAAMTRRSDIEEVEFLTLSWFTDHADQTRARAWARDAAQTQRPINYAMNAQLNADKKVTALETQVGRIRLLLPPGSRIIGGDGDPRPAPFLRDFAARVGCTITIIPGAGHNPWLEKPEQFRTALRSAVNDLADRQLTHQS